MVELCEVVGYACVWKRGKCFCWDDIELNRFLTPCPAPASECCPYDASTLSFAPMAAEPFGVPPPTSIYSQGGGLGEVVGIDDVVTELGAFAGNYECPHQCPP